MRHSTVGQQLPRVQRAKRIGILAATLSLVSVAGLSAVIGVSSASSPLPRNLVANPGLESGLSGWQVSNASKIDRVTLGFQSKWAGRLQPSSTGVATAQAVYTGVVSRTTRGSVFALGVWVRLIPQQSVTFQAREMVGSSVASSSRTVKAVKAGWYFIPLPYGAKKVGARLDVTLTVPRATSKAPVLFDGLYAGQVRGPAVATAAAPASITVAAAPSTPSVGGFPTPSSTGWQAGGVSSLVKYTGPTTITTSGTVIDGADIQSALTIRANNVTIKRSRILGDSTDSYVVQQASGFSGLTLSYVEVGPLSGQHPDRAVASFGTGLTVDHAYVHGTQRGIATGDGTTVTNSYIDDLYNSSQNHSTAVMSLGGTNNVVLKGNTLGCSTGYCSSALSVYPQVDFGGANNNWTIDSNLFNGGSYCVYLGYTPSAGESPNTNMRVTNNRFGTKYNADCGQYGPVGSWAYATGDTWTNNTWYAPGTTKNGTPVMP